MVVMTVDVSAHKMVLNLVVSLVEWMDCETALMKVDWGLFTWII